MRDGICNSRAWRPHNIQLIEGSGGRSLNLYIFWGTSEQNCALNPRVPFVCIYRKTKWSLVQIRIISTESQIVDASRFSLMRLKQQEQQTSSLKKKKKNNLFLPPRGLNPSFTTCNSESSLWSPSFCSEVSSRALIKLQSKSWGRSWAIKTKHEATLRPAICCIRCCGLPRTPSISVISQSSKLQTRDAKNFFQKTELHCASKGLATASWHNTKHDLSLSAALLVWKEELS